MSLCGCWPIARCCGRRRRRSAHENDGDDAETECNAHDARNTPSLVTTAPLVVSTLSTTWTCSAPVAALCVPDTLGLSLSASSLSSSSRRRRRRSRRSPMRSSSSSSSLPSDERDDEHMSTPPIADAVADSPYQTIPQLAESCAAATAVDASTGSSNTHCEHEYDQLPLEMRLHRRRSLKDRRGGDGRGGRRARASMGLSQSTRVAPLPSASHCDDACALDASQMATLAVTASAATTGACGPLRNRSNSQ